VQIIIQATSASSPETGTKLPMKNAHYTRWQCPGNYRDVYIEEVGNGVIMNRMETAGE
jgi:hypothetical protein